MLAKVVGISESGPGVYQGHPFHNLVLHVLTDDQYTAGKRSEQLKLKYARLHDLFNLDDNRDAESYHPKDFLNLLERTISYGYDKYRNIDNITVIKEESKSGNNTGK